MRTEEKQLPEVSNVLKLDYLTKTIKSLDLDYQSLEDLLSMYGKERIYQAMDNALTCCLCDLDFFEHKDMYILNELRKTFQET